MKNNIRFFTIMVLTFILLISSVYPVQANPLEIPGNSITPEVILNRVHSQGVELSYIPENIFDEVKYSSNEPTFTNYKTKEGSNVFEFYDNGIENSLEITSSGDLYLDSNPITIENYDENNKLISKDIVNIYDYSPLSQQRDKFTKLPSGVKDSDLNEYLGRTTHVVSIGEMVWKDVGVAVIISILTYSPIGLWGILASGVAQGLVTVAKASTPYSNYLSYEKSEYRGRYLGGYTLIVRTYIQYFGNRDFTGHLGDSTYYTGYKS